MNINLTYLQWYLAGWFTPDHILGLVVALACSFMMDMAGREAVSSEDYSFVTTWFYRLIGTGLYIFSAYCISR